ncbi:fluoride efflux transporter CrcB [Eggerthella guodeyinii]|uniref:Fluoride-specific ion channel FluC n=1 Tax=Eggerthella guodeyinii TaxID=2690837 RepID=A0A6N7RRM0_9ACTN|nr:fluoride efflux transporter CrcB [Eggerthella guodeyinii]MRX83298.1 fluoride efflux transporter CrcB [Eggerthella guodeyinii]
MLAVLCVGMGGFIGSVGRYLLGLVPVEGDFPLMTFIINFAGAVLIGAVFEAATVWPGMSDNAVLFLKTGVCGGFTTFSAFSLETLTLLERGKYATGALYACGSVLVCLVGVALGRLLVRGVRAALTGSAEA